MKKMILSAFALIAFSTVSFAGEIEEKKTTEVEEKKEQIQGDSCCTIHGLAYDLARSEGASIATAQAYANLVYENCLKSSKSISAE